MWGTVAEKQKGKNISVTGLLTLLTHTLKPLHVPHAHKISSYTPSLPALSLSLIPQCCDW